jgi:hypothetical protein
MCELVLKYPSGQKPQNHLLLQIYTNDLDIRREQGMQSDIRWSFSKILLERLLPAAANERSHFGTSG